MEILRTAEATKPQQHVQYGDLYEDFFEEDIQAGRPSVERKINKNLTGPESIVGSVFSIFSNTNYDNVPCLHLEFWPDFVTPWFNKNRYWPKPEVMAQIHQEGCHLVWKSADDEKASWRLSFSQAEIILARERSVFQKKCFLLAKLIFTVQTQHFADQNNDRKLSSYLIKTIMNSLIEETPESIWQIWEEESNYFEVVENLFQRLSDFLKAGHMPCLFTEKMNLLRGFSQTYLDVMGDVFSDYFKTEDGLKVLLECFKESAICKIEARFSLDFVETTRKTRDAIEEHLPEIKEELEIYLKEMDKYGATSEAMNECMIRALEITGLYKPPMVYKIYRSIKGAFRRLDEWSDNLIESIFDSIINRL
eukprot:TCONS_00012083-protein